MNGDSYNTQENKCNTPQDDQPCIDRPVVNTMRNSRAGWTYESEAEDKEINSTFIPEGSCAGARKQMGPCQLYHRSQHQLSNRRLSSPDNTAPKGGPFHKGWREKSLWPRCICVNLQRDGRRFIVSFGLWSRSGRTDRFAHLAHILVLFFFFFFQHARDDTAAYVRSLASP